MQPTPRPSSTVIVLMGVSGSGKSTIAAELVDRLGWTFAEGDAMHPPENIERMAAGIPLTDADRAPWLRRITDWIRGRLEAGENAIVTCSALKAEYRDELRSAGPGVRIVYLRGNPATLVARQSARRGHFMPASLMRSQLETLEEPGPDEGVLTVDVAAGPAEIATTIIRSLGLDPA